MFLGQLCIYEKVKPYTHRSLRIIHCKREVTLEFQRNGWATLRNDYLKLLLSSLLTHKINGSSLSFF